MVSDKGPGPSALRKEPPQTWKVVKQVAFIKENSSTRGQVHRADSEGESLSRTYSSLNYSF